MVARVLVIGGYGNFGSYIVRRLARQDGIQVVIGGRNGAAGRQFIATLEDGPHRPVFHQMDYRNGMAAALDAVRPDVVVHTCGPFQGQDYRVAEACIAAGSHYVDLADARDFVADIDRLGDAARAAGVLAVAGASSVPCLTAAVIDAHRDRFETLDTLDYGIATAQQTNRGLATTSAVLSYAGKPFETLRDGEMRTVYGWQDLHRRTLPKAGARWFGNCDVPDLALFPKRYTDVRTIRFRAGLEVPLVHFGLWLLTWPVRWRLLGGLEAFAPVLLAVSRVFDRSGSDRSAFYMDLHGVDGAGRALTVTFDLVAGSGHGPYIPCAPAIILARRLALGQCRAAGAQACVGLIDLATYLAELDGLDISWQVSGGG